jgi:hypothetical protein
VCLSAGVLETAIWLVFEGLVFVVRQKKRLKKRRKNLQGRDIYGNPLKSGLRINTEWSSCGNWGKSSGESVGLG